MKFSIKKINPEKQRSACVVVGVFEPRKLTEAARAIDEAAGGYISSILKSGDMDGKAGSARLLHNVPNAACDRVLLIGLGKEEELNEKKYRDSLRAAFRALNETGSVDATFFLTGIPVRDRDTAWKVSQTAAVGLESSYRFDRLKSKVDETPPHLRKVTLGIAAGEASEVPAAESALQQGIAIAEAMNLAKDLGNLAPNICTPTYLAEQAVGLAKTYKLKATILEQKDMESWAWEPFSPSPKAAASRQS